MKRLRAKHRCHRSDAGHCLLPVSEYRQATMEVNLSTQEADTCDAFYLLELRYL